MKILALNEENKKNIFDSNHKANIILYRTINHLLIDHEYDLYFEEERQKESREE